MQVKKFEAPTLQEALDTIKRELGPEAIILQTKKNSRGFGLMSRPSVEVTAAISDRSIQKKQYVETRMPEPSRAAAQKLSADRQADLYDKYVDTHVTQAQRKAASQAAPAGKKLTATRYIDIDTPQMAPTTPAPAGDAVPAGLSARAATQAGAAAAGASAAKAFGAGMTVQEEVKHLKRMIEELKTAQESSAFGSGAQVLAAQSKLNTPALQDAFEQLVINGVDKRFAFALTKKVAFELGDNPSANPEAVMDTLASEIMESTEVHSCLSGITRGNAESGPSVIALVGPTGVGKTTTVAKMASEAILKRNLKVGLINLDSYKIAAFDQLGTYAKILNVPFRSVANAEELKAALADFQMLDLVIVDTTGRSQRDPASLNEMQNLLKTIPSVRPQLVLSVTTRDTELYDMANRFAVFRPEGIILSKLDEGTIYGAIYNICQRAKLPLVYFTTGQRVPEDIEEATQERVASLILDLS